MLHATPTLDPDAELALITAAQAGSADAMTTLITSHLRFLRSEARKYAAAEPLIQEDDLVSAGVEAVMTAVRSYDPSRGARLLTHARPSIGLAMAEEVATTGRTISVPGRSLRKYRKAIRETDSIDAARTLAHSKDGMDPSTFDAIHHAMAGGQSLDAGLTSQGADTFGDVQISGSECDPSLSTDQPLLGARGPAPEASAVTADLASRALAALGSDGRSRQIVALAYLSGEDLSDAQIAERLGLSRPTVTRVRNAALDVMRGVVA